MSRRVLALAAALAPAACAGSGSSGGANAPIDARGLPTELVQCRSRLGQEHNLTDLLYGRLDGLGERKLASRPGQESGVRLHPGDNVRIAFARQLDSDDPTSRELYASSIDASAPERRLTRDRYDDRSPTWLAGGRRLAFASDRSGRMQLWTVMADGPPDLRPLLDGPPGTRDLEPDARGSAVVFTRVEPAGGGWRATLWRVDESGAALAWLTDGGGLSGPADDPADAPGDHQAAWSPDRRQVAFVRRDGAGRARLHVLDVGGAVRDLGDLGDGDDAMPRFAPAGDRILVRRTAPARGILGGRLLALSPDGADAAWLGLDQLYGLSGFDLAAAVPAWSPPTAAPLAADLVDDRVDVLVGSGVRGRGDSLRTIDGRGVQVVTAPFDGREVAGIRVAFVLPVVEATDVVRLRLRVALAASETGSEVRLRVSVKNYVRNRFEVAWERSPASAALHDAELTVDSLAHVDRKRAVRVEIGCELGEGRRAELSVDGAELAVWTRP